MGNSNKLVNEQLMGNQNQQIKAKETVKYKGVFRIFGQLIFPSNIEGKADDYNRMGYIIMSEKTYQLKEFTVEQTVMLLRQFNFSNAKIDSNGKIIVTEHSIDRLPVFDMNRRLLKYSAAVMIIGKIINNDKQLGYRVINQLGRVCDISEQELVKLVKNDDKLLVNGKIVTRDNKDYISSIKTEFSIINKSDRCNDRAISNFDANEKNTEAENNRKIAKVVKLKEKWIPQVLRLSLNLKCQARTYFPMTEVKFTSTEEVEFKKLSQVVLNEIVDIKNIESDKDKKIYELLRKGVESSKFKLVSFNKHKVPKQAEILAFAMCQLCLYDDEIYNTIRYVPIKFGSSIDNNMVELLKAKGLYSDILDKLIKDKKNSIESKTKAIKGSRRTEFTQTTFENSKEIANLGFAISKQNEGIKWSTPFGSTYTLKYIGDLIPNFDEYKAMATTFGDMGVLAQIMRTFECNYFSREEKLIRVEVMLAIMSLYRPDIVAKFIRENSEDYIELKDMLPELTLDENSTRVDYGLDPDLEIYYTSAFNVFFNDYMHDANFLECTKEYSKEYLKRSTYVNYRRLGAGQNIQHNLLYIDLVPIINMITSGNCNIDAIESVIGRLRVL